MIVLTNNQPTLDATSHLNRLMNGDEADHESFMSLRHHAGVNAAAVALARRHAAIFTHHGAGRAIADAVVRLQAKGAGCYIDPDRVLQEIEDMIGEAGVEAENIAYAERLEKRFAEDFAQKRATSHYLVGWRLNDIQRRMATAVGDEARALADEARDLNEWLTEPWRHPANLAEISRHFAALQADPSAFDPPPDDTAPLGDAVGAVEVA